MWTAGDVGSTALIGKSSKSIHGQRGDNADMANPSNGDLMIPLSYLEEYARDYTGMVDSLFVLETCDGGFNGMPVYNRAANPGSGMAVSEILAAGPGNLTVHDDDGPYDWCCRIIGQLRRHTKRGLTVKELHALTHDPTLPNAPGFYQSDVKQTDDTILLAPMFSSSAAGTVLKAGEEDKLPDAIFPSSDLDPEHPARDLLPTLLADFTQDERRILQRLYRLGNLESHEIASELNRRTAMAAQRRGIPPPRQKLPNECELVHGYLRRPAGSPDP